MNISDFAMQEVQVTSVYFRNRGPRQRLESYPRRMVYAGREYVFVAFGRHYLIQKGQQLIQLFDVSDGHNEYRLRLDETNRWMVVRARAIS